MTFLTSITSPWLSISQLRPVSVTASQTRTHTSKAISSASTTSSRLAAITKSSILYMRPHHQCMAATRKFHIQQMTRSTTPCRYMPQRKRATNLWLTPIRNSTTSPRQVFDSSPFMARQDVLIWHTSALRTNLYRGKPSRFSIMATASAISLMWTTSWKEY